MVCSVVVERFECMGERFSWLLVNCKDTGHIEHIGGCFGIRAVVKAKDKTTNNSTERHAHTPTDRHTDTQTERQAHIQKDRHTGKHPGRHPDQQTHTHTQQLSRRGAREDFKKQNAHFPDVAAVFGRAVVAISGPSSLSLDRTTIDKPSPVPI